MNLSPTLKDLKTRYEKKYKIPAFSGDNPTLKFCESLCNVLEFHKRNFIESDITFINSLVTIHDELEK